MKSSLKPLVPATCLMLLLTQSCHKETDPFDDNAYLVSSKTEIMWTKDNMITLLNYGAFLYPELANLVPEIKSGVNIYSVEYNTTLKGQDVIASGLVAVPSVSGSYPVLSFQNGTNTLHANAPTADPDNPNYQLLECIAATGYVVVVADYLGFGASKNLVHPYLHKESTVTSLVDLLYALKEFDEDVARGITINNEYFLLGYSQGGWATLALLEALEKNFRSDFNVAAASCGAGPYDLSYFNAEVLAKSEYPMPVFLGYIANAYSEYDQYANPLTDLFNEPYAARIPGLYDGLHSFSQINSQLTVSIPQLFRAEYISGYATSATYQGVRNALAANSIAGWDSDVPILFTHGTADDYVMPELSTRMHDAMLIAGTSPATCLYVPLDGLDHSEGIIPAGLAAMEFFKTYR